MSANANALGLPIPRIVDHFTTEVQFEDPDHVVLVSGELDLSSRADAIAACTARNLCHVTVDLSNLAFMDCAGYGAFDVARADLEGRGGSLTLCHPTGQPHRFMALLGRTVRPDSTTQPGRDANERFEAPSRG